MLVSTLASDPKHRRVPFGKDDPAERQRRIHHPTHFLPTEAQRISLDRVVGPLGGHLDGDPVILVLEHLNAGWHAGIVGLERYRFAGLTGWSGRVAYAKRA